MKNRIFNLLLVIITISAFSFTTPESTVETCRANEYLTARYIGPLNNCDGYLFVECATNRLFVTRNKVYGLVAQQSYIVTRQFYGFSCPEYTLVSANSTSTCLYEDGTAG